MIDSFDHDEDVGSQERKKKIFRARFWGVGDCVCFDWNRKDRWRFVFEFFSLKQIDFNLLFGFKLTKFFVFV